MGEIVHVSDKDFEEQVLKAAGPVVVDFSADWCQPCRMLAPVIEQLAGEYGDAVKVCTIDVSANQETAAKYSVMSIPTVIVFKAGAPVGKHMGFAPKAALKAKIDAALK